MASAAATLSASFLEEPTPLPTRLPSTSTTDVNVGLWAGPCSSSSLYSGAHRISRCVISWQAALGAHGALRELGTMVGPSVRETNSCVTS